MDLSDLLKQCQVVSADQSSIDELEEKPAVYAFYDFLRFDPKSVIDDIVKFKTTHARTLELKTSEQKGSVFMPEHARLCFRGNPEPFKGQGKQLVNQMDPGELASLTRQLMFLSFFNEPLYIGKTGNMKERFDGHHSRDFLYLMKHEKMRHPGEFLLFVYYCDGALARPLESILLQLFNPPFSTQKS